MSEHEEAITKLCKHGYGAVGDGSAVIVIETGGCYGLLRRQSRAMRFESPELAVKKLIEIEKEER